MIIIKSSKEIEMMKKAGRISADALKLAGEMIEPGVSLISIDTAVRKYIGRCGARPSFLGYGGFSGSCCLSVNEQVIHGIPSQYQIKEGDIVSVDVGACYEGYHGDCADTFGCGSIPQNARRLIDVTRESFFEALKYAKEGYRIGDIGAAVEEYCVSRGYGVVYEYTGHGLGRNLHEEPSVPNLGPAGHLARLRKGMAIAIEPMINEGTGDIRILSNGWTVVTADGKLSAHYENSIAITDGEPIILTTAKE